MGDNAENAPKRRINGCLVTIAIIVTSVVALFWRPLIGASLAHGREFRELLGDAVSVTVIEYGHVTIDRAYDHELTRVDLSAAQIETIKRVFTRVGWIEIGKACDFEPHHRLVCVLRDGTKHDIHICFHCGDLAIDSLGTIDMTPWDRPLQAALTACGVPIRPELYTFD